ncbi:MAG: hypothetical protein JRI28_01220 [Deltaproteobacteria bacterium]|nr:hypothetical protein [Deltaproteobacteria bacterium]
MKIDKISIYKYNRPFKIYFDSLQTIRTASESIIIQVAFDNGICGYGESTPRSYVTGENQASVVKTIQDYFAPVLFSKQFNSIDDVSEVLNELGEVCRKKNVLRYISALGAVDLALLDALGSLQQSSVSNYLGPPLRKEIPYSVSIPALLPEKIKKLYSLFHKFTFDYVKIVLGTDETENVERVKLVRSLFGDHVDLRVEANGKLTRRQIISNLDKMHSFRLSAVEQPVAENDIDGLKQIKKAIDIPVVVDESMCSLEDARNLIEQDACDILNIKISKCGGILKSMQIADYARSMDIRCQMGAHVGETEILYLAGRHFAMTTPGLVYFEGCSFLLFEDLLHPDKEQIKSKREEEQADTGLGIGPATWQSIKNHCLPVGDLYR